MKYKVYDIHSHVVPAIDDGASSLDMSIEILRLAYAQGARGIVCTSHSGYSIERYKKNLKMLQDRAKKENINLVSYPIRHLGTEKSHELYLKIQKVILYTEMRIRQKKGNQ